MKITNVSVADCCSAPCILKRGTNGTVTIQFSTDQAYTTMTQKMCGELGHSCFGLSSLPTDFCKFTTCPVEAGKSYTAKIEIPILKEYPPVCAFMPSFFLVLHTCVCICVDDSGGEVDLLWRRR